MISHTPIIARNAMQKVLKNTSMGSMLILNDILINDHVRNFWHVREKALYVANKFIPIRSGEDNLKSSELILNNL
jgi:hypothetical protein